MAELVARDNGQLRRIDSAIARFSERPPAEQRKMASLLAALRSERAEIYRHNSRGSAHARIDRGRSGMALEQDAR